MWVTNKATRPPSIMLQMQTGLWFILMNHLYVHQGLYAYTILKQQTFQVSATITDQLCGVGPYFLVNGLLGCGYKCLSMHGCTSVFFDLQSGTCHPRGYTYTAIVHVPIGCTHSAGMTYSVAIGVVHVACPNGFVQIYDKCYMAYRTPLTWYQASTFCKELDADLVSMETEEIHGYVANFLSSDSSGCYWTGLTDRLREGDWLWEDRYGNGTRGTYIGWGSNEPTHGTEENCAFTAIDCYSWALCDVSCTGRQCGAVCQL